MKVVIISSVIFPRISPRSMRATELAKEFARQGNQVILYGVLGNYDYTDFEKKYNLKIKNLGPTKFSKLNSDGNNDRSIINKIAKKLFHKILEYPDIELAFKVNKALKTEKDIDLLISIAVPYPIHWGVALNKRKNKSFAKTWVADCGDPYVGNPFKKHPFYFKYIEKWFCRKADYLTVPIIEAKQGYYKEFHDKIKIIPQGFKFDLPKKEQEPKNKRLTFIYAGVFYAGKRDPRPFLEYLEKQNLDFQFIVYTKNKTLLEPYLQNLKDKLAIKDYIPREDLLYEMGKADFLVNIENINTIQSPSKLIDYAIAGRPVLSINHKNMDYKNIDLFLQKDYSNQLQIRNIKQYHIFNIVKQFIELQ